MGSYNYKDIILKSFSCTRSLDKILQSNEPANVIVTMIQKLPGIISSRLIENHPKQN